MATKAEKRQQFLRLMRPYPAHWVTAAMDKHTPGVSWSKCTKGHMADGYAEGCIGEAALLNMLDILDARKKKAEK